MLHLMPNEYEAFFNKSSKLGADATRGLAPEERAQRAMEVRLNACQPEHDGFELRRRHEVMCLADCLPPETEQSMSTVKAFFCVATSCVSVSNGKVFHVSCRSGHSPEGSSNKFKENSRGTHVCTRGTR